MTKHLVIGGAGFIGVNLCDRLLDQGDAVVLLDDFSRRGSRSNLAWLRTRHPAVGVVEADIRRDQAALSSTVAAADRVYHLAAQVAVTTSVADPRHDFEVNALGTLNVLEAVRSCREPPILLYSSTNKVYGQLQAEPIVEEESRFAFANGVRGIAESHLLDFHSPYGCSKGAADQYVRDYGRVYDLPTIVFRQSCIYGPRQFGIEDQGWLAWFAIAGSLGRDLTIFGTGKQVRDVLHVDDLIDAYLIATERIETSRGEVYNIGGGPDRSLSLLESLDLLGEKLGRPLRYRLAAERTGDQPIYVSDITKASTELGWTPRTDISTGIEALVAWVVASRELFENEQEPWRPAEPEAAGSVAR